MDVVAVGILKLGSDTQSRTAVWTLWESRNSRYTISLLFGGPWGTRTLKICILSATRIPIPSTAHDMFIRCLCSLLRTRLSCGLRSTQWYAGAITPCCLRFRLLDFFGSHRLLRTMSWPNWDTGMVYHCTTKFGRVGGTRTLTQLSGRFWICCVCHSTTTRIFICVTAVNSSV